MGSGRDERLRVKAETVRNRRSRLRRCNGATTHEPQEGRHRPRPRGGEEILGYEEERTPPGPRAPGSHAADPDKVVAQSSRAPKGPHPVHKPSAHEEREERWTSGLRPRRHGAGRRGGPHRAAGAWPHRYQPRAGRRGGKRPPPPTRGRWGEEE